MSENNKFKFVNDINKEDEIEITEDIVDTAVESSNFVRKKINPIVRHLKSAIIMIVVSALLVLIGLLWQDDTSLLAIGDALWLAFVIEFFAGWILFVYNHNIFSPLLYGVKSFALMFVGKRPKTDYYTYLKSVQDEPISAYLYIVIFISSFVLFIPALITLLILI